MAFSSFFKSTNTPFHIAWKDLFFSERVSKTYLKRRYIYPVLMIQMLLLNVILVFMCNCQNFQVQELLDGAFIERIPPTCQAVEAIDEYTIRIHFSEVMDTETLQHLAAYTIEPSLEITQSTIQAEGSKVKLTTSKQHGGQIYTLTLSSTLSDRVGNALDTSQNPFTFMGMGNPINTNPPQIIYPKDKTIVKEQLVTFRWSENTDASFFTLEIAIDSLFSQIIPIGSLTIPSNQTQYQVELSEPITYYARIRTDVMPENTWNAIQFERLPQQLYVYCPSTQEICEAEDRYGNLTKPYESINEAVRQAKALGMSDVYVAARGDGKAYHELIRVYNGIHIKGGFTSDFLETERNWETHPTYIQWDGAHTLLALNITEPTWIQGLYLSGKTQGDPLTGACHCVFIQHCTDALTLDSCSIINGNALETSYAVYVLDSGDVYAMSPTISNCVIQASNTQESSAGIMINKGAAQILDNTIYGSDQSPTYNYGILCEYSKPYISRNLIMVKDTAAGVNVGIRTQYTNNALITNNVIYVNGAVNTVHGIYEGQLSYDAIINNTIVVGDALSKSYGIYLYKDGYPVIINNLIVFMGSSTPTSYGIGEYIFDDKEPVCCYNNALVGFTNTYKFSTTISAMEADFDGRSIPNGGNLGPDTLPSLNSMSDIKFVGSDDFHLSEAADAALKEGGKNPTEIILCGIHADEPCEPIVNDLDKNLRTSPYSIGAYEMD